MKTIKQTLARERNWSKARLINSIGTLKNPSSRWTKEEQKAIETALILLEPILERWDINSEKLGLKVERYKVTKVNGAGKNDYISVTKKEAKQYKDDPNFIVEKIK
jgi:hypothetical protein